MNNMTWKDPIILGAIAGSGKFELIADYGDVKFQSVFDTYYSQTDRAYVDGSAEFVNDCQLIARPIKDMTDGEKTQWEKLAIPMENPRLNHSELLIDSPKSLFYLLSIGVLPESLADEHVIWRKENERTTNKI